MTHLPVFSRILFTSFFAASSAIVGVAAADTTTAAPPAASANIIYPPPPDAPPQALPIMGMLDATIGQTNGDWREKSWAGGARFTVAVPTGFNSHWVYFARITAITDARFVMSDVTTGFRLNTDPRGDFGFLLELAAGAGFQTASNTTGWGYSGSFALGASIAHDWYALLDMRFMANDGEDGNPAFLSDYAGLVIGRSFLF